MAPDDYDDHDNDDHDDEYDDDYDEDDEIKSYKIVYSVYFVSGRFLWGVFCLLLLTQQMKQKTIMANQLDCRKG